MKPSALFKRQFVHSGPAVTWGFGTRAGVTLTEVLMSLMIMSIGISAVMVLFPISVLRSVQSTQLTNAAILKYNTAAQIRQNPRLVFDPDGDFDLVQGAAQKQRALADHFQATDMRNYIVDPFGYHGMFGTDGNGDGAVDGNDDALARFFGNEFGTAGFTNAAGKSVKLRRYDGGLLAGLLRKRERDIAFANLTASELSALPALPYLASKLARLGDGRTVEVDGFADVNGEIILNGNVIGVRLAAPVEAADVDSTVSAKDLWSAFTVNNNPPPRIPIPELSEITLFSVDGRFSQTFPLIRTAGLECYWSENVSQPEVYRDYNDNGLTDIRPLPREFPQLKIGRVIIKSVRPADFSWLLTVRRSGDGQARGVDVVVRYHTGIQPLDEQIFPATFAAGAAVVGVNDARRGTDIVEPVLKRGSYVFDALNARWYRITNHQTRPQPGLIPSGDVAFWNAYKYRLTLESAVVASAGVFPSASRAAESSGAMFIPGVVDVYPLGSLSLPASLQAGEN